MQVKNLSLLALAGTAFAQQSNLTEVLTSQNSTLSTLIGLLGQQPAIMQGLAQAQNITILAPSNAALDEFLKTPAVMQAVAADPGIVAAILSYHVLNGTYYASAFTEQPQFIPTLLQNETYTNITGGQRVQAQTVGGNVTFFTALRENSTVSQGNLNFTAGTVHIIDKVLSVPGSINTTLQQANLTAAVGAIRAANVTSTLAAAKDLTIFVPNNAAFAAIGSLAGSIGSAELAQILSYHVVGSAASSPQITNTSLTTLGGGNITVRVINETVYVNEAKVVVPNILVENGVVHVIDGVLNPNNTSVQPDTSASTRAPAYSGASTATDGSNPFTSGVEAPSTTPLVATETGAGNGGGAVQTTTSSTQAAPMRTAAVGAAALFGGMAAYMNI